MNIIQKEIILTPRSRGVNLITDEFITKLPELEKFLAGTVHILLKHTSASLTLNENADPDVRRDMESIFNHLIPENLPYYTHTMEGSDDMPAHAKSSIFGAELTLPVTNGKLKLGTWQSIFFCDFDGPRNRTVWVKIL